MTTKPADHSWARALMHNSASTVADFAVACNGHTDLNGQDCMGYTLLHFAATYSRPDIWNWLIEQGANPDIPDSTRKTATQLCEQTLSFAVRLPEPTAWAGINPAIQTIIQ